MDTLDGRMVELFARIRRIAMPKPPTYLSTLKFLDRKQAAEYIGMSDFWLEKHCNDEQGPRSFRYGRKIWYRREDLDLWIKSRRAKEGVADDLWKRSEDRRLSTPPDETLSQAFAEMHGAEKAGDHKIDAGENALHALMQSLSPAQRALLASALHHSPPTDEDEK